MVVVAVGVTVMSHPSRVLKGQFLEKLYKTIRVSCKENVLL